MKNLFVILSIIIVSFSAYSQEGEIYLKNVNGEVTWQKVFENNIQKSIIQKYFQNSGLLKDIVLTDNGLTGELRLFEPDYKSAGYSVFKTPNLILNYYYSAFVSIQFKESRYRVTINKITLTKKIDDSSGCQGSLLFLNTYVVNKKGAFGKLFIKNVIPMYDIIFIKMFDVRNIENDDDW